MGLKLNDAEYAILTRAVMRAKQSAQPNMRILALALLSLGGELPAAKAAQWKSLEDSENDDESRKAHKKAQRSAIVCEVPVMQVEKLLESALSTPSVEE